ncbi:MAG: serine/threonine-protein kinase [Lachnospiraceae bacterium]
MLSLIGRGSSTKVYLVRHIRLRVYRAIKCISKAHSLPSQLSQEADLLRDLNHPGIPQIFDIEEDEEYVYVIEEYIQGESLQVFLTERRSMTYQEFLQYAIEICEILEYLHQFPQGPILNPDLKPEHIILCDNGVRLIDFGTIGKQGKNETNPYGTQEFSPPEWVNEGRCTVQSDVYSLGKVLGKLAGEYHFFGKKVLKHMLDKAAEREEEKRYESVTQIKELCQQEQKKIMKEQLTGTSGHLSQSIAIIGSQSRIGTTHIAVAFNCTANRMGRSSIYKENAAHPWLRKTPYFNTNSILCTKGGFKGLAAYGTEIEMPQVETTLIFSDCGTVKTNEEALEEYDLVILVFGGREWEEEESYKAIAQVEHLSNLILLCNFCTRRKVKEYARCIGCRVFCFPPDENPYKITRDKMRLLRSILKKGG